MPTRRQTLWGLGGAAVATVGGLSLLSNLRSHAGPSASAVQSSFKLPEILKGTRKGAETVYDLQLQTGTSNFLEGLKTETIGINQPYLGPLLEMQSGERVKLNVHNTLDETATLHWHGFHLPARFDGNPHQAIAPGETWSAQFVVRQRGGLYWYHSHAHKRSGPQVYRGLAGPIYVREEESDALDLPSEYGVTDLPLIVQDRAFQRDGQLIYGTSMHTLMMGMLGDTLLVNGAIDPVFEYTTDLLRLRLLNGSNARIYRFSFNDGRSMRQIASDGGLLAAPVPLTDIILSPGERAEILVDLSNGQPAQLVAHPVQNSMMGGRMMRSRMGNRQMRGSGPEFPVLSLLPAPTRRSAEPVPGKLLQLPRPNPAAAVRTRRFVMNMPMGMIVPGSIEERDFTISWQMWCVALEVPTSRIAVGWLAKRHNARLSGAEMVRDALDNAVFAGSIASLENHQNPMTMRDRTALDLDQFYLKRAQSAFVILLGKTRVSVIIFWHSREPFHHWPAKLVLWPGGPVRMNIDSLALAALRPGVYRAEAGTHCESRGEKTAHL